MPGSVANAAPTTVLPWGLCTAFSHSRQYTVVENEYRNGESQRAKLTATSRKSWKLTRRLAPAALAALRTFYENRRGPTEPFYFYDPYVSIFTYDPTGVQTLGRYVVRFEGSWEQTAYPGRADCNLEIIELA